PTPTVVPSTTLFRSGPIPHGLRLAILERHDAIARALFEHHARPELALPVPIEIDGPAHLEHVALALRLRDEDEPVEIALRRQEQDRKSTRLHSSHVN